MYSFAGVRILIVDDEELLREILSETFEMYGATVDSAAGGNEAFMKLQASRYDVLISDVRMPDGDGLTLMSKLRQLRLPQLKAFVCSAFNDLTDQKVRDLNIIKVFNKPYDLEGLVRDVAVSLQKA